MLYIHKLSDLHLKTAEIESVSLIRALRVQTPYPFTASTLHSFLTQYQVMPAAAQEAKALLPLLDSAVELLEKLLREQDSVYELINVLRARQTLLEARPALISNIAYLESLAAWEQGMMDELVELLNSLPRLRTTEQKQQCNERFNSIFRQLLRNESFALRWEDLVHEGRRDLVAELEKSIRTGFLFHQTLEEEVKKTHWDTIRLRIPAHRLDESEIIREKFNRLHLGLRSLYDQNMKSVSLAVILYSYIKWLKQGV